MTYLASEDTPIKPKITRDIDQLEIGRLFLSYGDVDEVSGDESGSRESGLHTVTEDDDIGGSIPRIEAMTREVEKFCQGLKIV
jgi:hypothetical protein